MDSIDRGLKTCKSPLMRQEGLRSLHAKCLPKLSPLTSNDLPTAMVLAFMPFLAANWLYILAGILCFVTARLTIAPSYVSALRTGKQRRVYLNPDQAAELPDEDADCPEDGDDGPAPSLPADLEHVPLDFERLSEEEMAARARDFYSVMDRRRTVRAFSSDPVPMAVIEDLVRTAGTAPSGAHTEPWTYVVVSTDDLKEQVREIVEQEELINYTQRMGDQWTTDLKPLRTNWEKAYLTDAPHLIMVFKQQYSLKEDGSRRNHYYNELSVAIASGILITAIHYAGLVTLTSTPLNCGPALRALLGRPANEKLTLLLPVGYPAPDATVPDLRRKPLDEILVRL
ncbi:iodotyrosine deiodinase isoform X2 [Frankliniella occidentalis]|uniref:Iodotyrosine deiodinase isoform X2 n=1 Tax=Frankliniella occidentalis TaxID=133901 RepID=A0A9C6XCK4_FRAOC|nr:iodotyrosine deiodinase isoform X2 [Frankliniella occidentalis]